MCLLPVENGDRTRRWHVWRPTASLHKAGWSGWLTCCMCRLLKLTPHHTYQFILNPHSLLPIDSLTLLMLHLCLRSPCVFSLFTKISQNMNASLKVSYYINNWRVPSKTQQLTVCKDIKKGHHDTDFCQYSFSLFLGVLFYKILPGLSSPLFFPFFLPIAVKMQRHSASHHATLC